MNKLTDTEIQKYLNLNQIFIELLNSKDLDSDKIDMMKKNQSLMKSILINLGVSFDDNDQIRFLNEKIRALQESNDNENLDYINVSSYIENLAKSLNSKFEEYGVSCLASVSFSPNLSVSIDVFSSTSKPILFSSTVEEQAKQEEKELNRHNRYISNFIVEPDHTSENFNMCYDDHNINLILKIVEDILNIKHHKFSYKLETRYNGKMLKPVISSFNITFLTLPSSQSLARAFSKL